jgi:acetoin:2,6-dichlorophenolindophenol oxidoreductase subunit beta
MTVVTMTDAITVALADEMRRDPQVLIVGEGVATKQRALLTEFGSERVRNTPLAEGIIAGTAAGAAASGLRPVIDLLFAPFLTYAMDEIVNSAGKLRFLSGGQFAFPMMVLIRSSSSPIWRRSLPPARSPAKRFRSAGLRCGEKARTCR